MTEWTKRDSSKLAPAALMASVRWVRSMDLPVIVGVTRADECPWHPGSKYHQPTDEDGTPYISADGLEEWARYVATDSDGMALQMDTVPQDMPNGWLPIATWMAAPETHRHPGDWRESLYRVWRDE